VNAHLTAEGNLLFRQNWGISLLQSPYSRIANNTACSNVLGAAEFAWLAWSRRLWPVGLVAAGLLGVAMVASRRAALARRRI